MKAKPVKLIYGEGYVECSLDQCTHLTFHVPSQQCPITLPVLLGNATRAGTPCWSWNGSVEAPTLKPSVLTTRDRHRAESFRCHSWINDGKVQFLKDCSHDLAGQTIELKDLTDE